MTDPVARFLSGTRWADWQRTALAGDASARQYLRLSDAKDSVILMQTPPDDGESTARFIRIAALLEKAGFTVPEILMQDTDRGLTLISDLGPDHLAAALAKGQASEMTLYQAATDVLIALRDVPPPDGLIRMTPSHGAAMIGILAEHYTGNPVDDLQAALEETLLRHAPVADCIALRDYHAENLIWRPQATGLDRIGLLDFQDAFVAPDGYDLVSLLRDVRRDVAPDVAAACTARFLDATGAGPDQSARLACLGVQRNLRILGVFARLARADGKRRYLAFLPRVWAHLMADLAHPALGDLQKAVHDTLPPPDAALIERLSA